MDNRLLSMYEHTQNLQAKDMHHTRLQFDEFAIIVSAQLAKADKEWATWGDDLLKMIIEDEVAPRCNCYIRAFHCVEERKKEIGL